MKHSFTPHITEKSYLGITDDKKAAQTYTFRVRREVTKGAIKKMVEKEFSVTVEDVRMVLLPGKARRYRGIVGSTKPRKKAIVRLMVGDRIAAFDAPAEEKQVKEKE
jgi:ribosomal protein L23